MIHIVEIGHMTETNHTIEIGHIVEIGTTPKNTKETILIVEIGCKAIIKILETRGIKEKGIETIVKTRVKMGI